MNTKVILATSLLLAAGVSANAAAGPAAKDFRYKRSEARSPYAQQNVQSGPVLIGERGVWSRNCTYQGGPKNGTWACRQTAPHDPLCGGLLRLHMSVTW
ncbi:MAG: hypothetical protein K2Y27_05195 [Xanthobacteraceae bacterium]|nr:hypothetical protein [Xanthobacteraceae bacterium]